MEGMGMGGMKLMSTFDNSSTSLMTIRQTLWIQAENRLRASLSGHFRGSFR